MFYNQANNNSNSNNTGSSNTSNQSQYHSPILRYPSFDSNTFDQSTQQQHHYNPTSRNQDHTSIHTSYNFHAVSFLFKHGHAHIKKFFL